LGVGYVDRKRIFQERNTVQAHASLLEYIRARYSFTLPAQILLEINLHNGLRDLRMSGSSFKDSTLILRMHQTTFVPSGKNLFHGHTFGSISFIAV